MANLDEVSELAWCLLDDHGLADWKFEFDNAKRRFGECRYGDKTIALSRSLTEDNGMDVVQDTILHEIAHALAGHAAHHGLRWQRQALAIGCTGMRCYDSEVVAHEQGPWVGTCPLCGSQHHRWRRPKRETACRECCNMVNRGVFMPEAVFVWEYRP